MTLRIGVDGRYLRDDHPGISRHLFELLRAEPGPAQDARVVLLHDPRRPASRQDARALERPGLQLVAAPWAPRSAAEQVALPRLLRRLELDVLLAPYPFTALRCPCPRVVTLYDVIALDPRHGLRLAPRRWLAGWLLRRVTRGAALTLTPSHAARADAVAWLGLAPQRVLVIGGAAAASFRPASRAEIAEARARLRLPERFVLHLGARRRHKNLDALLRAWATCAPGGPALVLAGMGASDVAAVTARARLLGARSVHVLGPVDERLLPALYSAAEVFVLPSLDEGFGLPVLEAMACGTPVACAARGALPEVAGDAAALFDPHDPVGLARTLERLLGDPRERDARARRGLARARAATWESVAARTWLACRSAALRGAEGLHDEFARAATAPLPS